MGEKKKMPFHLTVTDNETGKTIKDLDFDALIGAVHLNEDEAGGLFVARCQNLAIAGTIKAVERTLDHIYEEEPMLRLAGLLVGTKTVEKTENEE